MVVGPVTVIGALCDADWIRKAPNSRFHVSIFGRESNRIMHVAIGTFIFVSGLFLTFPNLLKP
ncbi:MAG: Imm17 family immunity protein [Planctomycetaceae bacterium]